MLERLYRHDDTQILKDIVSCYNTNNFAVVNFLYFANAMQYHLLEPEKQIEKDKEYLAALESSDFLLPDGIALQTINYFSKTPRTWVHNLNGTDLTPKILHYLKEQYKNVELYIVSLYDERIGKEQKWLDIGIQKLKEEYGFAKIEGFQTHFLERGQKYPWEQWASNKIDGQKDAETCRVVMHCTGSPFQEMWTYKHLDWYKKNNMLVLNVGGFIDFYSGFEKRAPARVVRARVLETFWRITTNPQKNLKKFMAMFGVTRLITRRIKIALSSLQKKGN